MIKKLFLLLFLSFLLLHCSNAGSGDNSKLVTEPLDNTGNTENTNNNFYINTNGLTLNSITITCKDARVGDSAVLNGVEYTKRTKDQITPSNTNSLH